HWADLPSDLVVGNGAGEFMPIFSSERGPELPGDQSREDRGSLVFDSPPLDAAVEIIGIPVVLLDLEASEPAGQIVCRLCEVTPDGRSRRLSWGARNLALSDDFSTRRVSRSNGVAVEVLLFGLAESIAPGNRLRIAVSASYWPMLWLGATAGRIAL